MKYDLDNLLVGVVRQEGSDLVLKADSPPLFRVHGDLFPIKGSLLTADEVRELICTIMSDQQREIFERDLEFDMSYEISGVSRYRVNIFQQREAWGFVARAIPFRIMTMEELQLPPICVEYCQRPRGMVLVTGPTGSGKSTSLSAMIDYINNHRAEHIVTIEDPIEFVYEDKLSLINQRELGTDTKSFANALKRVLRQDPDVILVGEMRDLETIALAITAAETGHLVFATLHTTDASQTVDRIIDVFPMHQQEQIRMQLAVNLVGIVSQTLMKRTDQKGRVAAYETLNCTSAVRNMIREGKTYQLPSVIETGSKQGMQSLDQCLVRLVDEGTVKYDTAYEKSSRPENFDALLQEFKKRKEQEHEALAKSRHAA